MMSDRLGARRLFHALRRDENGSSTTEYAVGGAIVALFAVPVIALIGSGAENQTTPVTTAMTDSEAAAEQIVGGRDDGNTNFGGVYAAGGEETAVANVTSTSARPGADKGVGFDMADGGGRSGGGSGSDRGQSLSRPGFLVRGDVPDTMPTPSRVTDASIARPERPPVSPRDRETRVVISAPSLPAPATGPASDTADASAPTEPVTVSASVDCPEPTRSARTILVGGRAGVMNYQARNTITPLDSDKVSEILNDDGIRVLDEEQQAGSVDCGTEIVRAAADQLGDGTVLAPVSISSTRDTTPERRRIGPIAVAPPRLGLTSLDDLPEAVNMLDMPSEEIAATTSPQRVRATFTYGAGAMVTLERKRVTPPASHARDVPMVDRSAPKPDLRVASVAPQSWAGSGAAGMATHTLVLAQVEDVVPPTPTQVVDATATRILRSGR